MVTTKRYVFSNWVWLLLLALVLQPAAANDTLTAAVDRTELTEGESLQLQVTGTMDVNISFNIFNLNLPRPELEPLKRDFDILEQRQRYNFQNINGQNQATVTWTYTLMPKRSGTLTIPSLQLKNAQSQPIEIEVSRQVATTRRSDSLFLEAEVSKHQLYVQEQLIYTLRLNSQDNILSGDLTEPELPNAVLRQIDQQKEYSRVIDGRRYEVIERRYVIFPQTSGTLEIPSQMFTGTLYDMRMRDRRYTKASTDAITVEVLPPPAEAQGKPWLPAMSLSLTENWSRTPENLDIGDSVTRTITIKALGLEGSQLPPLSSPNVAQLKQYPEQPQIESETHDDGVTGTRIERTAMVAVKGGQFELPEVSLRWWDTLNNEWKVAVVPARTVTVKGGAAAQSAPTPAPGVSPAEPATGPEQETIAAPPGEPSSINPWPLVSLALLVGWIATTVLLLARRKRQAGQPVILPQTSSDKEAQAFQQLASVSGQEWNRVRPALLTWSKTFWPERNIHALSDLYEFAPAANLGSTIQALEAARYSLQKDETKASGTDIILREVEQIRASRQQVHEVKQARLAELYPSVSR